MSEDQIARLNSVVEKLKIALHESINRPMGVVPDSALEFYDPYFGDDDEIPEPECDGSSCRGF